MNASLRSQGQDKVDPALSTSNSPVPRRRFSLKSGCCWPLDSTAKSVRPPPLFFERGIDCSPMPRHEVGIQLVAGENPVAARRCSLLCRRMGMMCFSRHKLTCCEKAFISLRRALVAEPRLLHLPSEEVLGRPPTALGGVLFSDGD